MRGVLHVSTYQDHIVENYRNTLGHQSTTDGLLRILWNNHEVSTQDAFGLG